MIEWQSTDKPDAGEEYPMGYEFTEQDNANFANMLATTSYVEGPQVDIMIPVDPDDDADYDDNSEVESVVE